MESSASARVATQGRRPATTGSPGNADPLLSVGEVARRLNVSTATVHRLIDERDIGHVRIGKRTIRIPESHLQGYVERCTIRFLK